MFLSEFYVDLHIHTVLSPCGELEMGAPEIIGKIREANIHMIAITDHNAYYNAEALQDAAGNSGPVVLPGMEVQTAEDIHVVVIFPDLDRAKVYQTWLKKGFMNILNRPDVFGYQLIIDKDNNIIDEVKPLLIQGVRYGVEEVIAKARTLNAIIILAHIDRPSFSYPAVLGPIPSDLDADALEVSPRLSAAEICELRRRYPDWTFVRSSDSHQLKYISRSNCCRMLLKNPCFDELLMALHSENGRCVFL